MTNAQACRICSSLDTRPVVAREMMFGLRERFVYLECRNCGCLQIAAYPEDIGRHYPSHYYAFAEPSAELEAHPGLVRDLRRGCATGCSAVRQLSGADRSPVRRPGAGWRHGHWLRIT